MSDFKKLKIWQIAHQLTLKMYGLTKKLPREEIFGLISQTRRAAISVESNIAEGESRYTNRDKINFFVQARSSASELQTQLILITDLYPVLSESSTKLENEYEILSKQINSLINFRRKITNEKNKIENTKT